MDKQKLLKIAGLVAGVAVFCGVFVVVYALFRNFSGAGLMTWPNGIGLLRRALPILLSAAAAIAVSVRICGSAGYLGLFLMAINIIFLSVLKANQALATGPIVDVVTGLLSGLIACLIHRKN